ncbi:MAG TPA: sigma-54 dependent transcriptional regulator [Vicinamibacterales bacterium]|nr:sigma-54 dependent transcriptional regulator [Vicinamibacterales bacterium]
MILLADRFACEIGPAKAGPYEAPLQQARLQQATIAGVDLATGDRVRLRIEPAGDRCDQQAWTETCTGAHRDGLLVDFGFIGRNRRFEAAALVPRDPRCYASPPPDHVMDWLGSRRAASPRILSLSSLPDGRALRLRGFVPLGLSLLGEDADPDLLQLIQGRSIVLLAASSQASSLSLALLKLRRANVRETWALSQRVAGRHAAVTSAAEGRAMYAPKPTASDARAGNLLVEGERLLAAGRHAGAERALRAAIFALERRGDPVHAGGAEMVLGRLLLTRGRAADARLMFERAHDRFQRACAAVPAVTATACLALAQADLGLLSDAERSGRAAYSAAAALNNADVSAVCAIGLARTLAWQQQYTDAEALLESVTPGSDTEAVARYWCQIAKLRLATNNVADAWRAVERARPVRRGGEPAIESLVRRWEAAVQAHVGDIEALSIHVRAGLAAARLAHLPLQAIRLRLVLIDGLIGADKLASARVAAARLRGLSRASIPPLLKAAVDRTLARLSAAGSEVLPDRVRESAVSFQPRHCVGSASDLDGMRELLSCSHQFEDEAEALTRAAACIKKHARALSVGIFGCLNGGARLFGSAGSCTPALALRSFNAGIPIGPEASDGWVDAAMPIRYLGRFIGALTIRWTTEGPEHVERATAFGLAAAAACAPLVYVMLERQSVPARDAAPFDLVGTSVAIEDVRKAIARAANAPFTVLIEGESGSGKELVARAIHRAGCRRERRFCAFNCAAMAEDLVDAELFGHAKGAFTGAGNDRLGLFESADGGTVFLDEVGELSARAQAKVLRVLQEGEVRRIGETVCRPFDARLVAATNRSLQTEVDAGRFRQDLLYRLDVIRINVPPLRERIDDIPLLATRFWKEAAARINSKAVLGQAALSALARYDWPGNVRELQNVLTALLVAAPPRGVVSASGMPAAIARVEAASHESLDSARLKFEQRFVRAALARAAGHRGRTAAALGLSRQGLAKLMQRLHLDA